jgi:hypothetical protein
MKDILMECWKNILGDTMFEVPPVCQIIRTYVKESAWRNTGMAPLILNFGTRWRCVVNFTFRPLYLVELGPVNIEKKAGLGRS